MLGIDRSGFYEIAETIADRDGHSVYAVREITLEAPGQLYRISLTTTGSHEALLSRFENIVLPFAQLRHSQVPLLCDAWVSEDFFDMVLLIPVCKPLSLKGPNPFRDADEATRMYFLRESLDFLAAMHDQEITHCHFREDCLGVDKRGVLYLHNPGIAERLIAVQREEDDDLGSSARLKLSANMKSIDVACWANSVASLLIGRTVLTYEYEEWDETELKKAETAIFGDLGSASALGKFLMQCLKGRMFDSVGYNSAREALKELDRIPPVPVFK